MQLGRRTFALLGLAVFGLTATLCWWPNPASVDAQVPANHWSVEFIPRQADSVSLVIDGKVWNPRKSDVGPTWERRDGRVTWALPSEFARHEKIRVVAVAFPWNTEAEVIIRHAGRDRRRLTFVRAEETEVIR